VGLAAMMLAGWGTERGLRYALRGIWQQVVHPGEEGGPSRVACLMLRMVLEFAFLLSFVAGALLLFFILWQGSEVTRSVVMTYLVAVVAVRVFVIFSHFLLAPHHRQLRLARMSDADTGFLHRHNIVMASIAAFGFLTCALLQQLGLAGAPHQALVFMVGVVLFATLAYTILRARRAISGDLAWNPERQSRFQQLLAQSWPAITAAFVVLLYLLIVLLVFTGTPVSYLSVFGTLLTVLFVPHFDAVLERAAQRLEAETAEDASGEIGIVGYRAGRIALYVAAAFFLVRIWGVDFFSLAERSMGGRFAGALVDIGLTALVAYVLWELARIAIDRRLAAESAAQGPQAAAEAGEQGGQGASRLRTLLPLMRVTIQVTIMVMAVMIVLSSLGVDIGPLLAGAGVVGLAVGFGAQTLVRDIVSGVFFLVDDAFRLGEYIDVGSVKGTVEKISIRSLRLRHHRGALHTIPFGEIQHLSNYSRDWAIMKLEFRVPFDTDLEKVRQIFKRIGKDLLQNPEVAADFLEPFKSQGVLQTDDSAFVIRGKFMSKPSRQFLIRRMVFQAVQKAFAEEGIHFADRRVTVNVPGVEHLEPEERAAVERAAASAVASAEAQKEAQAAKS
jgi:small-conductance mechanosensitive channel